ncbi:MAG: 3-oxoacyl-[acyl-carrier-protein] reductase FabG [Verrucomicrobiota bacterium]
MNTNPMNLSGRTVLVTGASSGLGKGIAQLLARLGAKVILVARDPVRLGAALDELEGEGHSAEAFDLGQTDAIPGWMREVTQRRGLLHGLVHSAGVLTTKPLRMQVSVDWELAMRINVSAGAALAKGFRQKGVFSGAGSVVYLSSVMGLTGQPGQILYSATKGALVAMTRSMALELAKENIRVNCVAPAVVLAGMSEELEKNVSPEQFGQITAMHPLGLGRPEDVAHAVAFLLADTARWITGITLTVDGGYTAH